MGPKPKEHKANENKKSGVKKNTEKETGTSLTESVEAHKLVAGHEDSEADVEGSQTWKRGRDLDPSVPSVGGSVPGSQMSRMGGNEKKENTNKRKLDDGVVKSFFY